MKRLVIILMASLSSVSLGLSLKLLHHQVSYSPCRTAARMGDLSYAELRELAQGITVKIKTGSTGGSGTLVDRKGSTYTVLTTAHVVTTSQNYQIETPDGQIHEGKLVADLGRASEDVALLQFQSSQAYQVAKLGSSEVLRLNQKVVAAGFAADAQGLNLTRGEITLLPDRRLQQGYQIGYTNEIYKGMSGGPVLNLQGELISINGMMAYPLWGNPYIFEDGSRPDPSLQRQMREVAWGIPIDQVAEMAPEWVDLNLVEKIDVIAQESTVLITNPKSIGSGMIVAYHDSTYYVLTAEHVIRNPSDYHLIAPDGQCYPMDLQTAQKLPGVDLAILQFHSKTPYQVATLGSYDWRMTSKPGYVFVSGWPVAQERKLSETTNRLLTVGRLLSQEPQIQKAMNHGQVSFRFPEGENPPLYAQGGAKTLSLTYGYEMVYSNLTAPGMSGGLVLDSQGHVIGVHGRGSGEIVADEKGEIRPIKLGYGVGIPIQTFLDLAGSVGIDRSWLKVKEAPPKVLSPHQVAQVRSSLLSHLETPRTSADAIAWFNYGMSLWQLEQYEESMLAFNWAIEQQPDFYQAWYGLGMMLRFQQRYDEALKAFEQSIRTSSGEFVPAWRARAEELVWLNQDREALESIQQAIALAPGDISLKQFQGHLFQHLQYYAEAIKAYEEALKVRQVDRRGTRHQEGDLVTIVDQELPPSHGLSSHPLMEFGLEPDVAWLYENWGDIRGKVTEKLGVISDRDPATELSLNLALAYTNRGNRYAEQEEWEAAIAHYSQALALEPRNPVTYGNRGLARARLGDQQGAIADLQQAAQLFDSQADVTNFQRALEVLKQMR